jgi:hypothetical protein
MPDPEPARSIKEPRGVYSPYFGCTIFIIMLICVAGGLSLAYFSLRTQDAAFGEIAKDQPAELNPVVLAEAERAALLAKLAAFKQEVTDKKPATLELSIAELNTIVQLAPDSGYGGFKSMIAFTAAEPGAKQLQAKVCLPVNKIKFWEGLRYLIGTAAFKPMIAEKVGIDMQMQSLTVPGKTVNQDLLDRLMLWQWFSPYTKLENIGPLMAAITSAEVTASGVRLSSDPALIPVPEKP